MRTALRNLDPTDKRALFTIGCMALVLLAAGLIFFAATGDPGLLIAVAVLTVVPTALIGMGYAFFRLAARIFPEEN